MSVSCECCVLLGRGVCSCRSLVQRSPTKCGVSNESDRETHNGWAMTRNGVKASQKI